MKEPIEFRKVREFGDIISDTVVFIKQNLKPLLKAYFYICGFFILASILSSIFMQLSIASMSTGRYQYEMNSPIRSLYNFGFSYAFYVIFLVLSIVSMHLTILCFVALYIRKGNVAPTVPEVWSYFKYYFWRMFGSSIAMGIFWIICIMLCIVPGIYVMPALVIFFPIMILENAGFSFAFERAFKLLKNEWWITFAVILVIYFIYNACAMVIQIPAIVISMASAFTHLEQPITKFYAIVTSLAQNLSQVFVIIPVVAAALIYFNLVERKESTGLMERIDTLGQTETKDDHPFAQEEY